ncbi:MAG: hypothetical protein U1F11_09470 [Steroidobacteraceae bacterium]
MALVPLTLWTALRCAYPRSTTRNGARLDRRRLVARAAGAARARIARHSVLGVQVVIEDYVRAKAAKLAALLASSFLHALVAAAGTFAVLKIAFKDG